MKQKKNYSKVSSIEDARLRKHAINERGFRVDFGYLHYRCEGEIEIQHDFHHALCLKCGKEGAISRTLDDLGQDIPEVTPGNVPTVYIFDGTLIDGFVVFEDEQPSSQKY